VGEDKHQGNLLGMKIVYIYMKTELEVHGILDLNYQKLGACSDGKVYD